MLPYEYTTNVNDDQLHQAVKSNSYEDRRCHLDNRLDAPEALETCRADHVQFDLQCCECLR